MTQPDRPGSGDAGSKRGLFGALKRMAFEDEPIPAEPAVAPTVPGTAAATPRPAAALPQRTQTQPPDPKFAAFIDEVLKKLPNKAFERFSSIERPLRRSLRDERAIYSAAFELAKEQGLDMVQVVKAIETAREALQAKAEEFQRHLSQKSADEVEKLRGKAAEITRLRDELTTEVNRLQEQINGLNTDLDAANTAIDQASANLSLAQAEFNRAVLAKDSELQQAHGNIVRFQGGS